jgi:hypothetical protein
MKKLLVETSLCVSFFAAPAMAVLRVVPLRLCRP